MAKPKITELRETYKRKSALELKSTVEYMKEDLEKAYEAIKGDGLEMAKLNPADRRYLDRLKGLKDDIQYHVSGIEYTNVALPIAETILEEKLEAQADKTRYDEFLARNAATLRPFLDAVEELRAAARWTDKDDNPLPQTLIDEAHAFLRDQTICMLMDRTNTVLSCDITYNGNKGFDGVFDTPTGTRRIQTVPVGGYNVVRFHYRTSVY